VQAEDRKSGHATRKWTIEEVVDRFSDRGDPDPRRAVSRFLDWADQQPSVVVETGSGVKYPTLRFRIQAEDHRVTLIVFWPGDNGAPLGADLYFGSLRGRIPTFADAEVCKDIARRIHDEIDSRFDSAAFEKSPSFLVQDEPAVAARIPGRVVIDRPGQRRFRAAKRISSAPCRLPNGFYGSC